MDNVCNAWVESLTRRIDFEGPIIEFGRRWRARDAAAPKNVYDLAPYFAGREYIGCDLKPGYGVDVVDDMECTRFPAETFGTILCLNTLEHVVNPQRAIAECLRLLRPSGILVLSSVFYYPLHSVPRDYWRFTPFCFREILLRDFADRMVEGVGKKEKQPKWVTGLAQKAPGDERLDVARGAFIGTWERLGRPRR